ncbi:MAG TPA: hypothetical protein VGF15_00525 [Solirubrobacteraceae bacterium]|jgi:hypothetical protein
MAQLSRPYQIALIAVLGLAMVWFIALRNHNSSSSGSAASTAQPASVSTRHATRAPGTAPISHAGGSPVEGLTRAVRKAHEAVGNTEAHAQRVESESARVAGETPPVSSSAATHASSSAVTHASTSAAARAALAERSERTNSPSGKHHPATTSTQAVQVERELTQGKTVLLLFWNSKSVDDRAVQHQLQVVAHALGRRVAIHQASASQIGVFGQLTQNVHVNQTPTILIINTHQKVSTLTGFTDAFVIRQAVREAQTQTG